MPSSSRCASRLVNSSRNCAGHCGWEVGSRKRTSEPKSSFSSAPGTWHRRAARRAGLLQRPLEENTRSGGTAGPRGGRGRCNDLQRRTHGQVAPQGREEGGAAATTFRGEHKVRWHRRAARRAGPLQRPSEENTKASTLTWTAMPC